LAGLFGTAFPPKLGGRFIERGGTGLAVRALLSDGDLGVIGPEAPSTDRPPLVNMDGGPDTAPLRTLSRSESMKEKSRPFSRSSYG